MSNVVVLIPIRHMWNTWSSTRRNTHKCWLMMCQVVWRLRCNRKKTFGFTDLLALAFCIAIQIIQIFNYFLYLLTLQYKVKTKDAKRSATEYFWTYNLKYLVCLIFFGDGDPTQKEEDHIVFTQISGGLTLTQIHPSYCCESNFPPGLTPQSTHLPCH